MRRTIIISCCLAFILGITAFQFSPKQETMAVNGSIAFKSKVDLINDASVIIKGTVKEILPSKWSNPDFKKGENVRNIIQTDILVNVDDVYKGTPYSKTVTVRIGKGTVGDTTMLSNGYPDFTSGEEVILFLSQDDGDLANPNENYYVLTGMLQGNFSLKESKDSDKIFKNGTGKDTLKLSTVKEEVKTTLDDLKKNPIPKKTKEEIRNQNEKVFGK